ncbi:hypothetical protein Catovirus_1_848 [Catovirus CTV1]|uniref:Uncharacterized protein n=1 Tax=Catovirus CTV1 TaxID=1977631 RepID=A0A1V0SAW5_9VIRU|nr:hypothetical protein Catovirus_1_848 [Catovirus CTV1]
MNCIVCTTNCRTRPHYFICKNNHTTIKHKNCRLKSPKCKICNDKLIGYSQTKMDLKFMSDYIHNYQTKYGYMDRLNKFTITPELIKTKLTIMYPTTNHYNFVNKLNEVTYRVNNDSLNFDNERDFDEYLFFIINKPELYQTLL